jgi:gas vesicle protein
MMKLTYLLAAASLATFSACEKKETPEVKEKVDDALDRRPNEGIKDAAEDVKDAAKDTGNEIKDAAKDLKDDVKDATR